MGRKILHLMARCLAYLILIVITATVTVQIYNYVTFTKAFAFLAVEWNDAVGTKVSNLKYAEGDFHDYDLYLPVNRKAHALILFIHGGAFKQGDKKDEDLWCKCFASKGYVTVTANYTLASDDRMANMNMMYEEMLQCVTAAKKEAESRGYHLTEMAVSGQSAGGYLALLYAYRAMDDSPLPVRFVFHQTAPATMAPEDWGCKGVQDYAIFSSRTTGDSITIDMVKDGTYREFVNQISPAYLVDSLTVPTLSAYGPRDKVVPVNLKYKLLNRLDSLGVPSDYVEFPHSGHAMIGDPDKSEEFLSKALEYCEKYFSRK